MPAQVGIPTADRVKPRVPGCSMLGLLRGAGAQGVVLSRFGAGGADLTAERGYGRSFRAATRAENWGQSGTPLPLGRP